MTPKYFLGGRDIRLGNGGEGWRWMTPKMGKGGKRQMTPKKCGEWMT